MRVLNGLYSKSSFALYIYEIHSATALFRFPLRRIQQPIGSIEWSRWDSPGVTKALQSERSRVVSTAALRDISRDKRRKA